MPLRRWVSSSFSENIIQVLLYEPKSLKFNKIKPYLEDRKYRQLIRLKS